MKKFIIFQVVFKKPFVVERRKNTQSEFDELKSSGNTSPPKKCVAADFMNVGWRNTIFPKKKKRVQ